MFHFAIAALVFATLFAVSALYVSLAKHHARLNLADGSLPTQWQPNYKRTLPIQSWLAIVGGMAGLTIGYPLADQRWFARSVLLLAN